MVCDGGELIKLCRLQAGLSKNDLAELVGVTKDTINNAERGKSEPKFCTVAWCIDACGFELMIAKKGIEK